MTEPSILVLYPLLISGGKGMNNQLSKQPTNQKTILISIEPEIYVYLYYATAQLHFNNVS
jgi:hypothetical protein